MAKNEQKKLFGKIHLLDILFILLVVAIVVVVAIKLIIPSEETVIGTTELLGSKTVETVEVTFMTEPYEVTALNNIKVGDKLVELKEYINGEIISTEIVDYEVTMVDNNGEMVTGSHPLLKRAVVTARAEVSFKDPTYKLGTIAITENKDFFMNTDTVRLKTIILSINSTKE